MGIDFLDVSFEVEKQFGGRITPDDVLPVWNSHNGDCTVEEFHDMIFHKCISCGVTVPRSSWNRVKIILVKTLGVAVEEVKKEAWLRRDLDFD